MAGQIVYIHWDTSSPVWGNGVSFKKTDAIKRPNIGGKWTVDANMNLIGGNSSGSVLSYSSDNGVFSDLLPVRLVMPQNSGTLNFVDFSTTNSGVTPANHSSYPSIGGGVMTVDPLAGNGIFISPAFINDIPRKSDGSEATSNSDASYYEIIILAKQLLNTYTIIGHSVKCVDKNFKDWLISEDGNRDGQNTYGGFINFSPAGGLSSVNISGVNSCLVFFMSHSYAGAVSGLHVPAGLDLRDAYSHKNEPNNLKAISSVFGHKYLPSHSTGVPATMSLEAGLSGIGIINRTSGINDSVYNSSVFPNTEYLSPVILYRGTGSAKASIDLDDIGIIGFDDIINA